MSTTTTRDLFRNDSGGWIGVVTIEPGGDRRAISVPPGHEVWLSEEEQILTANAPRAEADNPLTNGSLTCVTEAGDVKNRRALRPDTPVAAEATPEQPEEPVEEEVGAPPSPEGDPAEGTRPPGEEVATPEVRAEGAATAPIEPEPPQEPQSGREESPMRPATTEDDPTRPQPPRAELPKPVAR